ncbi:MAG: prepilin-type N-terminal cleavage/methylation domain-containing protein [Deltaproteobacteria bacterium]|jgi:type IV pilus assembly protein PilW|nr:prepilin-type N-terminal cleavage/methylation domain-containing protein [Deltaproteobacteria bacterium]
MVIRLLKSANVPPHGPERPGGFTLIELLVAMAVSSIVVGLMAGFFTAQTSSYTRHTATADIQQVVRAGIDFMSDNIRMAGLDPLQTGNFGIEAAGASGITFTADLDMNGQIDVSNAERIAYALNGNQVQQTVGAVTEPLVDNVTNFTFTYRDENELVTADPTAIRTVQISLTVQEPVGYGRTLARTYTTRVHFRNLGL